MLTPSFAPLLNTDNTALDAVFYDIGTLTDDEQAALSNSDKPEGMILEVGPSYARDLKVWRCLADCDALARSYRAITVAGVGSSALGAAALARNVADAVDGKVLAVVSGLGMADLTTEAMGGFFLFGGLNAVRHGLQSFSTLWPFAPSLAPSALRAIEPASKFALSHNSEDVKALINLLSGKVETSLLVGHSKGNLVISEALYALRTIAPERFESIAEAVEIVTYGARIAMPTEINRVIDVMGDLDSFGALNSRPDIAVDVLIPNAWHHTNTELPWHVPVTKTLRSILEPQS